MNFRSETLEKCVQENRELTKRNCQLRSELASQDRKRIELLSKLMDKRVQRVEFEHDLLDQTIKMLTKSFREILVCVQSDAYMEQLVASSWESNCSLDIASRRRSSEILQHFRRSTTLERKSGVVQKSPTRQHPKEFSYTTSVSDVIVEEGESANHQNESTENGLISIVEEQPEEAAVSVKERRQKSSPLAAHFTPLADVTNRQQVRHKDNSKSPFQHTKIASLSFDVETCSTPCQEAGVTLHINKDLSEAENEISSQVNTAKTKYRRRLISQDFDSGSDCSNAAVSYDASSSRPRRKCAPKNLSLPNCREKLRNEGECKTYRKRKK